MLPPRYFPRDRPRFMANTTTFTLPLSTSPRAPPNDKHQQQFSTRTTSNRRRFVYISTRHQHNPAMRLHPSASLHHSSSSQAPPPPSTTSTLSWPPVTTLHQPQPFTKHKSSRLFETPPPPRSAYMELTSVAGKARSWLCGVSRRLVLFFVPCVRPFSVFCLGCCCVCACVRDCTLACLRLSVRVVGFGVEKGKTGCVCGAGQRASLWLAVRF